MVGLNHRALTEAGFDHVCVDGALAEEIDRADFLCLALKDANKLLADNLPLLLGLFDSLKLLKVLGSRIHADKV